MVMRDAPAPGPFRWPTAAYFGAYETNKKFPDHTELITKLLWLLIVICLIQVLKQMLFKYICFPNTPDLAPSILELLRHFLHKSF